MVFHFLSWSQTAASNATADGNVNWAEGQAPSTVNDSARAMMAALAAWRDDTSGSLIAGGTSTALTLTTNQNFGGGLIANMRLSFRVTATNGASPTLAVDGTTAYPISYAPSTPIPVGALSPYTVYDVFYRSATNEWMISNLILPSAFGASMQTGFLQDYIGTAAPSGYVLLSGRTIGDGSSGGTERANADTAALYDMLWNNFSNTICPVSSGRGASSTADFAAHKTIQLIDFRGRVSVGKDNMGGSAANVITNFSGTTLGQSGGEQNHALTSGENGPHTHSVTDPGHNHHTDHIAVNVGATFFALKAPGASTDQTGTDTTGISIVSSGSGTGHNNIQPSVIVNKICKL